MKVLHLLQSSQFSGAENVVCQIIDMFRNDKDIEMVYCSSDGPIRQTLDERRIRFVPLKKFSVIELKRAMKEEKPDLIHAHDFRASILSVAFSKNIPVISHLHNNSPWLKKRGIKSILYAFTCRYYKKILTVSPSVFDEFVYGKKFKDKLTVIGNPVNTDLIRLRVNNTQTKKVYDLGFCGRLSIPKNPKGFINIVEKVRLHFLNVSSVMIGDGELKDEIVSFIKEKNLDGHIKLLGFLKEPYSIIQSCKILCVPSRWEGFGLVAVEALALGVPVVCSDVGGLPTIINDECGKVCVSEDEMVVECLKLLSQNDYFDCKVQAALERAAKLHNIDNYQKILHTHYVNTIGQYNGLT